MHFVCALPQENNPLEKPVILPYEMDKSRFQLMTVSSAKMQSKALHIFMYSINIYLKLLMFSLGDLLML